MAKKGGNPQNLIPIKQNSQEAKEAGRLGGIASGRARRLKKLMNGEKIRRFEIEFFDSLDIILNGIFNGININRQFQIGRFRLDGFIPVYNIAIEYDDKYHKYRKDEDRERQIEVDGYLKMKWVRVEKGFEIEGIRDILKAIILE